MIGEANLFVILPGQSGKKFLRVLVTRSWTHNTLIMGLPTLKQWGIVSKDFPLPKQSGEEVLNIPEGHQEDVTEDTEGKHINCTPPQRQHYVEPDYNDPGEVSSVLEKVRKDIL